MNRKETERRINSFSFYSLPALEEQGVGNISRLPVSIRIMLESLLRNCDGKKVRIEDVVRLAEWDAKKPSSADVPFCVSRVLLQDFTGVPLLVDLAAMRDAIAERGVDPKKIEPQVKVDLIIDHSVQVDRFGSPDAFLYNLQVEFKRNQERYEFLKWGQKAFHSFQVVPPGVGICHQVNLEYLATVVSHHQNILLLDTLVGTDSHTTMINGLGVLGWGVGGIEAEAAMLGQPVSIQTPEVVGVHVVGRLNEGVTATDLTLRVTELLRKEKVVGKFVEFFGTGASSLSVADRATIGNMAPEYGATVGFFPVDDKTIDYLYLTGREEKEISLCERYLREQKLFGIPQQGEIDYTRTVELDLASIEPSVAGPKRPQDRIPLTKLKEQLRELWKECEPKVVTLHANGMDVPHDSGGTEESPSRGEWSEEEMVTNRPFTHQVTPNREKHLIRGTLTHGSVVIAAITSCTNTSNPSVMIAAGLLAKKAFERGLTINPLVKTSLAPGSRVVTDYLEKTGLQKYLDALGFQLVAYGCTTCIGNSGPLDGQMEDSIKEHNLIVASVLSGNRNFEARIHSSVKANFLMSPPLVIAFALAGRVNIDLDREPLSRDSKGNPVFLKDLWPSSEEIAEAMNKISPDLFKKRYAHILTDNPVWSKIQVPQTAQFSWGSESTYIRKPPFFDLPPPPKKLEEMKVLAFFGDSITTDHISPAGAISENSPAGKYLISKGIKPADFNSYGSRRGNHEVMMRGTFANPRIVNALVGKEGGYTKMNGELFFIYDACQLYAQDKTPLIIFAGKDYGMGSSRDWAAKGTALLGVRVVVAESFERIHRSNLIGMGVLPLRFREGESRKSHKIVGTESFSLSPLTFQPQEEVTLNGIRLISCLDTPTEVEYYRQGGILPFVVKSYTTSKK